MKKHELRDQREVLQKQLRLARLDAGLRQVDLAEKIHQNQSFISKYESGERRLDLLELREVCQALGVSLQQFVTQFEKTLK